MAIWWELGLDRSLFCRHVVPIDFKRLLHHCLAELLAQCLFNGFHPNGRWIPEILWRFDPFTQQRARRILHFHRLDGCAAVGQIGGKDIQRQNHHAQICPGHFDEELVITHPYLPDFPAIDNRRERTTVDPSHLEGSGSRLWPAKIGPYSNPFG